MPSYCGHGRYTQHVTRLVFLLLLPLAALSTLSAQDTSPNTLFLHGNIMTGAHLRANDTSPTAARVQALAVTNSTITAVGTDEQLLKLKGPHTQVVDLHGAFVMPGFNDAHTHLADGGLQHLTVNLENTASLGEMQSRIATYTASAKPGQWIVGSGWDHTKWVSRQLPTRQDIDKVTAGHPAVFYRVDGHIVIANTAALEAANISTPTLDPPGGKIDRDQNGIPTGIIREAPAIEILYKKVPQPDSDTRTKALLLAINDALAHGVTSLQDFSTWEDWLVLESLERNDKLPIRIGEWIDFNLPLAVLKERRASHSPDDPRLHLTQLKGFMDGSLGSRTAALAAPYADDQNNSGIPRYEQERLNQMATERASAGFQLGFHAIGDQANTMALNAFAAAEQVAIPANAPATPRPAAMPRQDPDGEIITNSNLVAPVAPAPSQRETYNPADLRFRIEHAQVLLPEDFERFEHLGVIASMQPSHLLTDMNWAAVRLGPERAKYAYAWRSMLDHHVTLAFGTDYPVESINPFRGLYAAVTRQNEAGTMSFHPEQRITLNEALYAYTQASAYAEFREDRKGRLEAGYLADFILLDRDITAVPVHELLSTKVLRTVVGGQTVYAAQ